MHGRAGLGGTLRRDCGAEQQAEQGKWWTGAVVDQQLQAELPHLFLCALKRLLGDGDYHAYCRCRMTTAGGERLAR